MKNKAVYLLGFLAVAGAAACKNKASQGESMSHGHKVYKGLYSFSPDIKSFKECGYDHEYWVTDSSAQLELQYSQLNLSPEQPVYIQVQGKKIKTPKNGIGSGYDTTLIVTKLIRISKDIPNDVCN